MSGIDGSQGAAATPSWGRVRVHAGDGLVHRSTDVLLVVPAVDAAVAERTAELLRICDLADDPGGSRRVRRLAWMITDAEPDEVPSFAFVVAGGDMLRVMAHGDVAVTAAGGTALSFNGAESLAWVERAVPATFDTLVLGREGAPVAPALLAALDLEAGTVPGGGVTLCREPAVTSRTAGVDAARESSARPAVRSGQQAADVGWPGAPSIAAGEAPARLLSRPVRSPAPPVPTPPADPRPARPPVPAPGPVPASSPPTQRKPPADVESVTVLRPSAGVRRVVLSAGSDGAARSRPPLPVGATPPTAAPPGDEVVRVRGVVCASCSQFNDPETGSCGACGARLDPSWHRETRPRPPLGILITDDGRVCTVSGDLVIGREPTQAPDVKANLARPLVVQDAEHSTSRVHAHLRLIDWKVLLSDGGSSNGTFVSRSGPAGPWTAVPREPATRLEPGDRVRLGKRELLFDRYHDPL